MIELLVSFLVLFLSVGSFSFVTLLSGKQVENGCSALRRTKVGHCAGCNRAMNCQRSSTEKTGDRVAPLFLVQTTTDFPEGQFSISSTTQSKREYLR